MTPTNRRASDAADAAAIAVLQNEQKNTTVDLDDVRQLLSQHVNECARLQKWVLGVLIFIAGWAVAHSPEVLKLLTAIASAL